MKLFAEMMRQFSSDGDFQGGRVQYTVVDGGGGYFRNVKGILEFSQTSVLLKGKKGAVRVTGEGLYLGKYFADDLTVLGKILSVRQEN